jgi:hypothetical protein
MFNFIKGLAPHLKYSDTKTVAPFSKPEHT